MTLPADWKEPAAQVDATDDGERLRRLFAPWALMTCEARLPAVPPTIPAEEAQQVIHAVSRRRVEFATARWCARRVLGRLGITDFVLKNDAQRAPLWPVGIVGSLTHTGPVPGGYCAVAVARDETLLAVGIDAEAGEGLADHLAATVLTASEQAMVMRLARGDAATRRVLAKVIFSAKEAVYKAQFPLTRRWLDFHDVSIELDLESEAFAARFPPAAAPQSLPLPLEGRFSRDAELVITALAVPRLPLR